MYASAVCSGKVYTRWQEEKKKSYGWWYDAITVMELVEKLLLDEREQVVRKTICRGWFKKMGNAENYGSKRIGGTEEEWKVSTLREIEHVCIKVCSGKVTPGGKKGSRTCKS